MNGHSRNFIDPIQPTTDDPVPYPYKYPKKNQIFEINSVPYNTPLYDKMLPRYIPTIPFSNEIPNERPNESENPPSIAPVGNTPYMVNPSSRNYVSTYNNYDTDSTYNPYAKDYHTYSSYYIVNKTTTPMPTTTAAPTIHDLSFSITHYVNNYKS